MAERDIFIAALQQGDPAQRRAYLDEACAAHPDLRRQVEDLLRLHEAAGSFLEKPAAETAATGALQQATEPAVSPESPGTRIGPYKLIEPIGEGGMGAVWLAQQTEPVRRLVALKLIKAGMDSKQVIARFEAERQALALMDHVNIARVLDGGTTDAGRPYFVMDLVKGVPITRYCDEHHLTPRQRLELFIPVCQAVQHAHQKGVIDRDLKPSNVLVALYDGKPVPKVIDFGIAKAAGQQLTEKTLVTGFGAVVGTPQYMSPEQATLDNLDIDTRSDIYSLGVLLYELLAGTPPFTRKELEKGGMLEMLRVIREQEPTRPSAKLRTAEGLPTLAANRGTEPAKLTRLVRGELDWIVMKALEKDRSRRYETANGFALDVQRYLADEAVLACPPSTTYRLRKFARRNKAALAVAALVLFFLALLGGGVGWAVRDRSAREAEAAQQQAARQGKVAGQVEPILAEVDRLEGEQNWPEALAVARRAEAAVASGEADAATVQRVRQVLHALQMVAGLEELRMREAHGVAAGAYVDEGRPRLYAAAFRDFGVDVATLPAEEAAARLRARPEVAIALAAVLDDWARAGRGQDPAQSKRLGALAAAIDPDPWRVSVRQASAAMDVEALLKLAKAPDTARQPPQSLTLLASSLRQCDQPEQALALLERACEIHPGDFCIHFDLGAYNTKARPPRLEAAVRHCMAARALRPRSAATWYNLGNLLRLQKKSDEAIRHYCKAIEFDPKHAAAHNNLGGVLMNQKKLDEAIVHFKQALDLDPKYAAAHSNLGLALQSQGRAQRDPKKLDEAAAAFRKAMELDSTYADTYIGLANDYSNLGVELHRQKKLDQAIYAYKKAIELNPKHVLAHNNLGALFCDDRKEYDKAIECFRTAIKIAPKYANAYRNLNFALTQKGWDWVNNADPKRHDPKRAVEAVMEAVQLDPQSGVPWQYLGWVQYRLGDWRASIEALDKSCKLDKGGTGDSGQWIVLALAHARLAAQEGLPDTERAQHQAESRRRFEQADKQIDRWWRARPGHASGQDIWDFRAEARRLMALNDGKK